MPETASTPTDLDLISFLQAIPDARMRRGVRIPAWYLLWVAVLGILSRCQSLRDLESFAIRHHAVLTEALGLELRRPPSDSAFRYFFQMLDVAALCAAIRDWTIAQIPGGAADLDQLVTGGMTLRGSIEPTSGGSSAFIAQVTLYSAALSVAISQACYATGENHERAVLRQLLGELDLDGVLIQADALHTQKPFFRWLQEQGADFLLTVKANQQTLYRQIRSQFQGKRKIPFVASDHEVSHGRDITWMLRAKEAPEHIAEAWIGTSWIVEVAATGTRDGKPFQATHLFLTSLSTTPEALLQLVRDRWSLECWHWICDTQLRGCPLLPGQRGRSAGHAAHSSTQPAAADRLSVDQGRHAGGDARHHGAA